MMTKEGIAAFLRERRVALNKTQVEVAREAFDDERRQSYVSTLERGEALPDVQTLLKLGKALSFSLSDIEDAVSSITPRTTPPTSEAV